MSAQAASSTAPVPILIPVPASFPALWPRPPRPMSPPIRTPSPVSHVALDPEDPSPGWELRPRMVCDAEPLALREGRGAPPPQVKVSNSSLGAGRFEPDMVRRSVPSIIAGDEVLCDAIRVARPVPDGRGAAASSWRDECDEAPCKGFRPCPSIVGRE